MLKGEKNSISILYNSGNDVAWSTVAHRSEFESSEVEIQKVWRSEIIFLLICHVLLLIDGCVLIFLLLKNDVAQMIFIELF